MNTEQKLYEADRLQKAFPKIEPNWNSPITQITKEIEHKIVQDAEENLMAEVISQIGYDIDKEKLIKALEYSKNSYYEGFNDAVNKYKEAIKQAMDEITDQGAYFHEIAGDIEYVKGISFCLDVLNKYFGKEES